MASRIRLVHQGSIPTEESSIVITRSALDDLGEETLRINHSRLREILTKDDVVDRPVAFIGITGCMRTGKSFIMNYILRYLRQKGWENEGWMGDENTKADRHNDIEFRRGSDRHTTGLRIFHEKFEVPINNGKTMTVMILDTQGLFDHRTPEQMNKAILTLSTMLCSVQIFNVVGQINAEHLRFLEPCIDFAEESATEHKDDMFLKLQRLMLLIRDYPEEDDSCFSLKHGNVKLDKILKGESGGRSQLKVRRKIRSSFDRADCFPLPFPGEEPKKQRFQGMNKELRGQFLQAVKSFVEEIAHPKKLIAKQARSGRYLSARELMLMISGCDNLFAKKMFKASLMIEENVEGHYAAASQEAIFEYMKAMQTQLKRNISDEELQGEHELHRKLALRRYDAAAMIAFVDIKERFKKDVEDEIKSYYEKLLEIRRSQKKLKDSAIEKEVLNKADQKYRDFLERELCNTAESLTLDQIHSKALSSVIELYCSTNRDKLANRSAEILKKHRDMYEKKLLESVQAKKDLRKEKLFRLVQQELPTECRRMWNERLERYGSIGELEDCKEGIDTEIYTKFWKSEVNAAEYKYILLLRTRLANEKEKVRHQAGWKAAPEIPEAKPRSADEKYIEELNKLARKFAKDLQLEIKKHLKESIDYDNREKEIIKDVKKRFYEFCNADLKPILEELDGMLCREYDQAKISHGQLWSKFEEDVNATVDGIVAQHEKSLAKRMIESHIVGSGLQKYYSEAMENAKIHIPDVIEVVTSRSDNARQHFDYVLKEKMDRSLEEHLETNKKNMARRQLHECSPPVMKSIFANLYLNLPHFPRDHDDEEETDSDW